jgi:hypothetical protein
MSRSTCSLHFPNQVFQAKDWGFEVQIQVQVSIQVQLEVPNPGLNPGSSIPKIGVWSPDPGPDLGPVLDTAAASGSQTRCWSRFFKPKDRGFEVQIQAQISIQVSIQVQFEVR